MARFEVSFSAVGRFTVEVDADSEEAARQFVRCNSGSVIVDDERAILDFEDVDITWVQEN